MLKTKVWYVGRVKGPNQRSGVLLTLSEDSVEVSWVSVSKEWSSLKFRSPRNAKKSRSE